MDLRHLKQYPPEKVRALFGLTLEALGELLTTVLPELVRRRQTAQAQRPNRQRAMGGGRHRRLKPSQEVNTFANYPGPKEGCTAWIRPKQATVLKICANRTGSGFSGSIFIVSSTYL